MSMSKNLRKRPPPSQSASMPAATAAAEPSTEFNPVSKWQECVEIPGLTQFDIHRQPLRENAEDSSRVRTMQLDDLGQEFRCPVCLGYIKNARIVKQCLHRFCDECIEKCLRLGKNKECPECRAHIPCRRSLRPDKKFDELMKSIYGDVEKIEKYEEEEIARLNKKKMNNRKRPAASIEKTTHSPTKHVKGVEESVFVDIVLKRHPQETTVDRLKRESISTPQDVTVEKLKDFLGQKLGYSPCSDFQITTIADGNPVILPNDISLELIRRDICDDPTDEFILNYRIATNGNKAATNGNS